MQYSDDGVEPLEQIGIALPEFIKLSGLFLEYVKDRIRAVTAIDSGSKRMVAEIFPSFLGVVLQGGFENRREDGGSGECIRS